MKETRSIDLLKLEMEVLWGPDRYGRPKPPRPLVAVAATEGDHAVRFGTDALGEPLDVAQNGSLGSEVPPPEIEAYHARFAAAGLGTARLAGGPSYVVARESLIETSLPTDLRILAANRTTASELLTLRPEEWWEPEEWTDLVFGRLGPCAFGLAEGRVAALCHTSAASSHAAEAGVWTHPEARRRGYGAAVTTAWARLGASCFEALFYSTTAENVGSQGIARRLRLRPIGWIWWLTREP